jgi:hypothetical protein
MRRFLSIAGFVSTMVLCTGMLAYGCGDKLLVMGRGIRLQTLFGNRNARILAYQHAGTHGSDVIADSEFQSALKSAGYQLRVVRDTEELEVALRLGKYDLAVADIADADAVESALQSVAGAPVFLPILYQPAKPELALAEKHYHYVLKVQRNTGGYLSVIEQALETKLEAEAKLKREHRRSGGAL